MWLTELIEGLDEAMNRIAARQDGQVTGLTCDSRAVRPGYLFAALPGAKVDGREFIPEAIRRGATVVLTPPGRPISPDIGSVRHLTVENPRRLFALMAARFHARQPDVVAAVTGTKRQDFGGLVPAPIVGRRWARCRMPGDPGR